MQKVTTAQCSFLFCPCLDGCYPSPFPFWSQLWWEERARCVSFPWESWIAKVEGCLKHNWFQVVYLSPAAVRRGCYALKGPQRLLLALCLGKISNDFRSASRAGSLIYSLQFTGSACFCCYFSLHLAQSRVWEQPQGEARSSPRSRWSTLLRACGFKSWLSHRFPWVNKLFSSP